MTRRSLTVAVALFLLASPVFVFAQQGAAPAPAGAGAAQGGARGGARGPAGPAAPANVALQNPRNDARHAGFVEIAKAGNIDLLFLGDSITDVWEGGARKSGTLPGH